MEEKRERFGAGAYKSWFLPAPADGVQPTVGDVMPYYEDGVFYIYYLKDGGDSFNHSIFLAITRDFASYEERRGPILEAGREGRDFWMGTGSVVRIGSRYILFYTGHNSSPAYECDEVILVAEGDSPTSAFRKLEGWMIKPPAFLNQRLDFRDPQAVYDPVADTVTLTVTASHEHTAKVLKFTVSGDLQRVVCDGFIFVNDKTKCPDFWNLECTDTFRMGNTYYLTYSAQNDTLWYAMSDAPYGPYGDPVRLDGKLFYSARHVENGSGVWMVGWARRSADAWGGNLAAQELRRREDGTLYLAPVDAVRDRFRVRRELASEGDAVTLRGGRTPVRAPAFACLGSFMLTGRFRFEGGGPFGLEFDPGKGEGRRVLIDPRAGKLRLVSPRGGSPIAESPAELKAGEEYGFTYLQEGDLGFFYIDGVAALTVRVPGTSGTPIRLFVRDNAVEFSELREFTE